MPQQLTSRQRVLTAFGHQEPDHVPCWLGASPEWKELARQHLGLADDESLLGYLGDDFRRVHSRYAGPSDTHPTANLTHPDATYRTPFGVERHGYGYGMPLNIPLKQAKTLAEVDAYPWPDPEWIDVSHIREEALKYDRQSRSSAASGPLLARRHRPAGFRRADPADVRQPRAGGCRHGALRRLLPGRQPAHLRGIRRRHRHLLHRQRLRRAGRADAQPKFFRRFILPHLKRFVDLGHGFGKYVLLHCDGSIRSLIPDMIAVGLDGMQSVQPLCTGMELSGLKRDFGGQFTFVGGIDTQALIEGTAEQARQLTLRTLEIMMPGGGFIASPSHDYLLPERRSKT